MGSKKPTLLFEICGGAYFAVIRNTYFYLCVIKRQKAF